MEAVPDSAPHSWKLGAHSTRFSEKSAVKDMSCLTSRFTILEKCTYGIGNDMFPSDNENDESESIPTEIDNTHNLPPTICLLSEDPR